MGKRVVIIGGGIVGLFCARYCAREGHEVTVVERGGPDHDCCCRGNAGMICPSHFVPLAAPGMVATGLKMMGDPHSPFYIRPRLDWGLIDWGMKFIEAATPEHVGQSSPVLRDLHLLSRAEYVKLAREKGFRFGLKQNGLLMLCRGGEALLEESEMAETARTLGIPAQTLGPEETARLDPGIDMNIAGAVYFPNDCHLNPAQLLADLTRSLHEDGVRFQWNTEVADWSIRDGVIRGAATGQGFIEADEFVLAGGAHSPTVAARLGLQLPMQAGKGYSVTLDRPPQRPRICSILTEARVAVTPIGRGLRFGGTMEIAGLNRDINPGRVKGITDSAQRYFPAFTNSHFAGLKPWAGLRPCSPDGLPYIGRTRRAKNLLIATGHAMLGLSLAPATGIMIARQVSDLSHGQVSPRIDPDRYSGF